MLKSKSLKDIITKKSRLIIGLNSGTSADGIDAAIVGIRNCGFDSKAKFIAGHTYKFSSKLQAEIKKNAEPTFKDGESWLRLDIKLAGEFSKAALKIFRRAGINPERIDVIGSHGQTIRHLPLSKGDSITYQLADPARIAAVTGITTVGDFRVADIGTGGEGAPLTPIVNAILFGKSGTNIGVLNIGGISNISEIKSVRGKYQLFGCDTGPGNMLVDYLSQKLFKLNYDKSGKLALKGKANIAIVKKLLSNKYFKLKGPKSTGRERFNRAFCESFLTRCRKYRLSKHDIMATAVELTCAAVRQCSDINKLDFNSVILTGGGSLNQAMRKRLIELFPNVEIKRTGDYGFPEQYLEAVSFAILANECLCSNRYELKNVTGARKPIVLGKICQA